MPPRFTTSTETGKVAAPGCSNTKSTLLPLPVISQMPAPNLRASLNQTSNSAVPTCGSSPQQLNFLRLMTPRAPSCMTKSRFSSSDTTPMALAPEVAMSWTAIDPRPQHVRAMPEQHAIGGGQHEHVGCAFFPGEMSGSLQQLAILHSAKLGEG